MFLDIVPGATRTTALQVTNGSEEEVTVNAELLVPEQMHLAVNGRGVKGDDLACTGWVTVSPSTFTLRGHARRNLTVMAKMPKEATKYPSYYGTLKLHVSYADGKSARGERCPDLRSEQAGGRDARSRRHGLDRLRDRTVPVLRVGDVLEWRRDPRAVAQLPGRAVHRGCRRRRRGGRPSGSS